MRGRNVRGGRRRVNPFDFDCGFPTVFKQGGFDAVIGNPPYGAFAGEPDSAYYRNRYVTLANSLDTFIMFVEKAARLLRPTGSLGFIIPSGWVSTPSSRPLREFFLQNFDAESFVSLPFNVFGAAYIDAVIVTARKRTANSPSDGSVTLVVFLQAPNC